MKKIFNIVLFSFVAVLLSCGDDRSGEFYEVTKENQWIYSVMKERYLWSGSMPSLERNKFFTTPSSFFTSLLHKDDKVSFFDESESMGSYGMRFVLLRDPLGIQPGKVYALVKDVDPGSPAYNAGVRRGTWISAVAGMALSTTTNTIMSYGTGVEVVTEYIAYDEENGFYWAYGETLSIQASTNYSVNQVTLNSIYDLGERRVGYILLAGMDGDSFVDETMRIMNGFANNNVTDIVIDLRYCKGGTPSNAVALASSVVPTEVYTAPFCSLKGTGGRVDKMYAYSAQEVNLGDKGLYIIIGNDTHGVAELFTSSVVSTRGAAVTVTVGSSTAGGGLVTEPVASKFGFTINPVVARMYDSNENTIPLSGVAPAFVIDEFADLLNINELGSEEEYILMNVFYLIANGTLPDHE